MTHTRKLFFVVALLLIATSVQNIFAQIKTDIHGWKDGDFTTTWTEYVWEFNAADFKKGENTITFSFGWGSHMLCLKDVTIIADGKTVASVPEQKTSGNNPKNAVYTFNLTSAPRTLTFKAMARTGGGNNSNGKININGILYLPSTSQEIKGQAYYGNKDIVKVVIPSSVTKIGGLAFHSCPNLKEIEIPSSVKTIGDAAFQNCTALEKVTLHEGLMKLSYRLFKGCTNLKEITIPSTVTEFGSELFADCKNLKTINVDRYTESHAFYSTDSRLAFTDTRPKQTKEQWLATAKNNIIDDGILYVGMGVTKINDGQYKNRTDITEIRFKNTTAEITSIGANAFTGCTGLKKIVIPGNVKTIADGAFAACTNLEEVILEEGVENIRVYSFYDCKNVTSVTLPLSLKKIASDNGIFWQNKSNRVFHCYLGSQAYNLAVQNGCGKIDIVGIDEEHKGSIDLKYMTLGGNKTVKAGLFRDMPFEQIDLNNDITEIGKNAFNDKTILRVKRNTYGDKWAKSNGYYLCGVLADLNTYTKDRTKQITEDFTRILCDDDTYLNWTSYQFKVQEPLTIEEVDGEIVLTSFMLEPCENVTVTKSGKTILSKKTIQPLTRTVLSKADDAAKPEDFRLMSDDELYKKLTSLGNVLDWTVSFNGDHLRKTESGNKGVPYMKMLPVFCREWIATICNHAYVIASKEYEDYCLDCVEKKWLVTDEWQTKFLSTEDMRYLLQKTRKHTFKLGRCDGGGLGSLNGEGLWLLSGWFRNAGYDGGAFYHEFSHNMGYNHEDGNMCNQGVSNGYGEKSWQLMGTKIFKQLFDAGKLPYTNKKIFNSDLFSHEELNSPDPAENVIKNGVLYVAEGVPAIGNEEYAINRLISKVVFSSTVEVISTNAFWESYISELDIPSTVKKIGRGAFEGTALTSTVVIPNGVKEIGTGAFFSTQIPKIVVPASVTKFGEMITNNNVVWVVERGTPAYEYAVKSNYQIEVPGETPEEAAASIVKEKAVPGPKYTWKSGDFPMDGIRMYWDFSEFLDGEGRYVVTFTTTSGLNRLWLTDAIFIADGKLLEQFPRTQATLSIGYIINIPAGTKKLEFYALAHTNRGTDSIGKILVEKR